MRAALKKRPTEIQQELTPSLEACVRRYLGEPVSHRLANPGYFFENTLIKGPLEDFLRAAFEGLKGRGVRVLPLRIGFGFGKTHAQILLLHSLLAPDEVPERAEAVLRDLGWDRTVARKVLVLPLDFFDPGEPPFPQMAKVVRAYAEEGTKFYRKEVAEKVEGSKDALLSGFLESDRFASILADIALAAESPLLVMVDELGLGFVKRAERYLEAKREAKKSGKLPEEDPLAEVHWLSAFLTALAGKCEREGLPLVLVYAWAEQDLDTLRHLAEGDERVKNMLEIVRSEVMGRLSRYAAGMEEGPLGLNPDDMLDIAVFRVLEFPEEEAERTAEEVANTARAYGAIGPEDRSALVREIRRHYPLSPALAGALRKLARRQELPGAEHVRSAIYLLSLLAERALHNDPRSPLLGVKHMTLEEASFLGYMGDLRQDWASLISDLSEAINSAHPKIKGLCEHIAKLICSKAATVNIFDIERAREKGRAHLYGLTYREILLSLVCTTPAEEVGEAIGAVKEALSHLVSRSGRVEERIIDGERFYFPTLLGTVFGRYAIYRSDEERKAAEGKIEYIEHSRLLSQITSNIKAEGCSIYQVDFDLLQDPKELRARIGEALNEPRPAFVFIEPWNIALSRRMGEQGGFVNLSTWLVNKMNEQEYVDVLGRPLYLVVLLPNIEPPRIDELIRPLVEYEATEKFLAYLDKEEDVRREMMDKALSTAAVKRVRLTRRELERIIKEKVGPEIEAARRMAESMRLRAAREGAVKFLNLFDRYITYDLSQRAFALKDLSRQVSEAQGRVGSAPDPEKCADAIGSFFEAIVGLQYVRNLDTLERAVQEAIEERVKSGLLEPLNVEELAESFYQGSYEVVPLSGKLLEQAILRLDGITFELPDKKVTVSIEDGKISFSVEEKERPPEVGAEVVTPGPSVTVAPREVRREVSRFALRGLSREEMLSLGRLVKEGAIGVREVAVELRGEKIEGSLRIEGNFERLTAVFNALSAIAQNYKASLTVSVSLSEALEGERLREVLGDLAEKLGEGEW